MKFNEARSAASALSSEYANDTFLATYRCLGSYYGELMVHSGDCCVLKLYPSGCTTLSGDKLKTLATCWVLDTANWTDGEKRCNYIRRKVEASANGSKISVVCREEYGSPVLVHRHINQGGLSPRNKPYSFGYASTFTPRTYNEIWTACPTCLASSRGYYNYDRNWWYLTGSGGTFAEFSGNPAYGRPLLIVSH